MIGVGNYFTIFIVTYLQGELFEKLQIFMNCSKAYVFTYLQIFCSLEKDMTLNALPKDLIE